MTLRSGVYIVPTDRWYIERTVWLIAGVVLLASTAYGVAGESAVDFGSHRDGAGFHQCRLYGFLPGGQRAAPAWFHAHARVERHPGALESLFHADGQMVSGAPHLSCSWNQYLGRVGTDARIQRRGLLCSRSFVGGAMVWFAATGFCVMANGLYWLGAEPRLAPEALPSGRCTECPKSGECLGGHPILARGEALLSHRQLL